MHKRSLQNLRNRNGRSLWLKASLWVFLLALSGCATKRTPATVNVDYQQRVLELQRQLKRTQAELDEQRERNAVLERHVRQAHMSSSAAGREGESVADDDSSHSEIGSEASADNSDDFNLPEGVDIATKIIPKPAVAKSAQSAAPPGVPVRLPAKSETIRNADHVPDVQTHLSGEHLLYSKVLQSYRTKNSDELKKTIILLLKTYPDSPFADNALYLDGLLAFERGDLLAALQSMNRVIKEYPQGNKAVSALFAKGAIERRLSRPKAARESFLAVRKLYPGSPEANRVALELRILDLATQRTQ